MHKMQTVDFNTLEAAAKAAKQAENYLKQTASDRVMHVHVHALNKRHQKNESSDRDSKKGD